VNSLTLDYCVSSVANLTAASDHFTRHCHYVNFKDFPFCFSVLNWCYLMSYSLCSGSWTSVHHTVWFFYCYY